MPKKAPVPNCTDDVKQKLYELSNSRISEARLVERAKMIICLLDKKSVTATAEKFDVRPNTVIDLRRRFEQKGIDGLFDRPRSGKPPEYGKDFRDSVLKLLEKDPPDGLSTWDGPTVAKRLDSSPDAVWRVLRKEGISLQRQRSWCVSTDPEFAVKAADVVGLYLNPPENALILSLDEKPSMQAIERKTGYVMTDNGKIVRGLKSTYKRHGTLNLFAALEVATGAIHTKTTQYKKRVDFLEFMDDLIYETTPEKELHVIMDNYCIHKKNDAWLIAHPNVHFHFTPTSASWLNQVEIWFGIMSRKVLRGGSFKSQEELRTAIEAFIKAYGPTAKPFVWRKREVKGSQIRNTIVNLCN
jgi:transposase